VHTQERYRALREWATLIIALFGLSSIWFAIVQEWDADKSRRIASYAALAPQWLEVDKAFLQYPELRPYFNGEKLKSADPTSDRVLALSDLALDTMDNMLTLGQLAGYANEMAGWKLTFRRLLQNSPAACDRFRHSPKNLFGPTFAELAEASCVHLLYFAGFCRPSCTVGSPPTGWPDPELIS